jgi:hypothetical protein
MHGEKISVHKGKSEGKRQLGRPGHLGEDNMQVHFREKGLHIS